MYQYSSQQNQEQIEAESSNHLYKKLPQGHRYQRAQAQQEQVRVQPWAFEGKERAQKTYADRPTTRSEKRTF
jgi:hypothetical protein